MPVQAWLNRVWYERASPPWWLRPLSLSYGAVADARRYLYAHRLRKSTRTAAPVVVVGNLSVGGTGKTPLVCWLVARLVELGFTPGVVASAQGGALFVTASKGADHFVVTVMPDGHVYGGPTLGMPVGMAADNPNGPKRPGGAPAGRGPVSGGD